MKILGHPISEFTRPADLAAGVFVLALVLGTGPILAIGDAVVTGAGGALSNLIFGVRP